ncbi:transposase [Streptomyces sp. NPDC090798]|uniref:transposase n=1 Tax=Streptomyces sp. NPDC090798 TaxID=3365968 RepID=UPI0037F30E1C
MIVWTEAVQADPATHRSRKVHAWLAAHPDRIELHFLPPCSSELNPDKLVNSPTSSRVCRCTAGPAPKPNSLPKPACPSIAASANHASPAATSAARTSATPPNRTHCFSDQ